MDTIYLSLRAQVAVGTFFMKSPVVQYNYVIYVRLLPFVLESLNLLKMMNPKGARSGGKATLVSQRL